MSSTLITNSGSESLATLVLTELTVNDFLGLPRRGYDFNKGDRRFTELKRAVDHADETARQTGIRQVVRIDGPVLGEVMYLVQAVGS